MLLLFCNPNTSRHRPHHHLTHNDLHLLQHPPSEPTPSLQLPVILPCTITSCSPRLKANGNIKFIRESQGTLILHGHGPYYEIEVYNYNRGPCYNPQHLQTIVCLSKSLKIGLSHKGVFLCVEVEICSSSIFCYEDLTTVRLPKFCLHFKVKIDVRDLECLEKPKAKCK
ncbi:unnamed protein product [Lactuca virosa]|uniref:Uncharacterized protein n=1 Tax=Lactuca virosa TaxID=75947 RepID=A0AAU9LG94_9ASTR|nr:unnamed protein product [Lactuca virosa]